MHEARHIDRSGEFGNAEQWVCHHVRRWILEGVLRADEEINQQDLASRLGVSRSPVRDALRGSRAWAWSPSTPVSERW